jgi:hypothetical protein
MTIIEIIQNSIESFDSCDWRHEYSRDGKIVPDVYCEGDHTDCSYCEVVRDSVSEARSAAEIAIAYFRRGDMDGALRMIKRAVKIEGEWGDSPAYRPSLRALRALAE